MVSAIVLVGASGCRHTLRTLRRAKSVHARGMASSPLNVQRRDDGIFVFKIDVAEEKMNVLNANVMSSFDSALADLEKLPASEKPKAVVVLSGKPESFIAGESACSSALFLPDFAQSCARTAVADRKLTCLTFLPQALTSRCWTLVPQQPSLLSSVHGVRG